MKRFATLLLILFAWPMLASAEHFPALYNVVGVASDDTLNVRSAPNSSGEIIGELKYNATDIEVVSANASQSWGLVNIGERSGWVSLSYMQRLDGQPDNIVPTNMSCYGTEPFWNLQITEALLILDQPDSTTIALNRWDLLSDNNWNRFAIGAGQGDNAITGILRFQACDDGMSDRDFGISIDVLHSENGQQRLISGCCSLSN